jgi:NCAIR mutase (PurE)-related protein
LRSPSTPFGTVSGDADDDVDHLLDFVRAERTGVSEAVLAEGKSNDQLLRIGEAAMANGCPMLFTRLELAQSEHLTRAFAGAFHPDRTSGTGVLGLLPRTVTRNDLCVISAGTSDVRVAAEAVATLRFHGALPRRITDVGVAGLWRLLERIAEIRDARIVIAGAGMEGALFSVLAGLIEAPLIAVPTSVGYGVGVNGQAALSSALASCAPGVLVVNIDNGFGAACAALKIMRVADRRTG